MPGQNMDGLTCICSTSTPRPSSAWSKILGLRWRQSEPLPKTNHADCSSHCRFGNLSQVRLSYPPTAQLLQAGASFLTASVALVVGLFTNAAKPASYRHLYRRQSPR